MIPRGSGAQGLTLVEVLVAMAMVAIALFAVFGVVTSSVRSFGLTEGLIEVQQQARFILERMTEEARWADGLLPEFRCRPAALCPDSVVLHVPASNPLRPGMDYQVEFRFDARTGRVVRRQGSEAQDLGDGVTALRFTYFTGTGEEAPRADDVARLQLTLTLERRTGGHTRRRSVDTDILLRNLRPPVPLETPGDTASPPWRPEPGAPDSLQTPPPDEASPSPPDEGGSASPSPTPSRSRTPPPPSPTGLPR